MVTGYVQFEKLVDTLNDVITKAAPPEARQMWPNLKQSLGLRSIKRIVASSGFAGKDWETRIFVAAPEPREGLLGALIGGKPLSNEILTVIPKTATMAGGGFFNPAGLISVLRTAGGKIEPSFRKRSMNAQEYFQNRRSGRPEGSPRIARRRMGLLCRSHRHRQGAGGNDDGQSTERRGKIWAAAGQAPTIRQRDTRTAVGPGRRHRRISPHKRRQFDDPLSGIPADHASVGSAEWESVLGLYPQVVSTAAAHVAGKGKSILDNPAFVATAQAAGRGNADSIQFVDLPSTAPDAYASWVAISRLAGFGDLFGVASPPMMLPPLGKMMAHLSPVGQVTWTDAEGFHLRAVNPFPGSEVLGSDPMSMGAAQQAVMISILLPALNRAREQANRVKSASNLRQMGLGALLYANAQPSGAFPPDLATLVNDKDPA